MKIPFVKKVNIENIYILPNLKHVPYVPVGKVFYTLLETVIYLLSE